jgi:hypothetical protein
MNAEARLQHLMDLEEIRLLKAKYCRYNDGGWPEQPVSHQGPCADLFTEDGVWDGRPVAVRAEGREEIRKLFAAFASLPMAYHAVTQPMIEIHGDRATGHWHLIAAGLSPSGDSSLALGGYEDEYVRTPEGWRIKSMRVIWGPRTVLPVGWKNAVSHKLEAGWEA